MKKATVLIALLLILTLCGCTGVTTPKSADLSTSQVGITAKTERKSESENESSFSAGETTAETTASATEKTEETTAEQTQPPTTTETTAKKPTVTEETPKETAQKPAETTKTPETKPQTTAPVETTPTEQTVTVANATAADSEAIANKILEYINAERSTPATKLSGLTKYAEYRSWQLVSNFAHSTADERAAATALQYGEYVDPSLYGMNGDPYYSAGARDAIAKAGYTGTVENIAGRFCKLIKNSPSHWAYVGSSDYQYIGVGVTYRSGMWYCDVAMALENTDNK